MIIKITKNEDVPHEILNIEDLEHKINIATEALSRGFLFPGISEFRIYESLDLSGLVISIRPGFKLTLVSPCILNSTIFKCQDSEPHLPNKPTQISVCYGSIGIYKIEGRPFETVTTSPVWDNQYDSSDEELALIAELWSDSEN